MSDGNSIRPIVVGVSGSRASRAALRWAAEQARAADVPLVAVHAWQPSAAFRAPYAPVAGVRSEDDDRHAAGLLLDDALCSALPADLPVEVRPVLVQDRPVPALLRYAAVATLLAVGRWTPPADREPRLGPVARDCVTKAACPVVTVPADAATAPPARLPSARRRAVVAGR